MDYDELVAKVIELLEREKRVPYRALKRRFDLDDDYIEDLKDELIYAKKLAIDEDNRVLVWVEDSGKTPEPTSVPVQDRKPPPISYTPKYLTEKILTTRSALEGERKQVTVMFADIKDSTELIRDLDPEAAAAQICSRFPSWERRSAQATWDRHRPSIRRGSLRPLSSTSTSLPVPTDGPQPI